MAAFKPTRIASPEVLKQVHLPNLLALLSPYADFLNANGVALPAPGQTEGYDYHALATVLLDASRKPPRLLVEALFYIHEFADPDIEDELDLLLEACPALPAGHATLADVTLHLWLNARNDLLALYPRLRRYNAKSACTFPAAKTLPPFKTDRIPAMQADLDEWFQQKKRRCGGTEIIPCNEDDGSITLIVKHPDSYTRVGLMDETMWGFPERYDFINIRFNPAEIVVVAPTQNIRDKYRAAVGQHLFADDETFAGDAKYSLEPIRNTRETGLDFTGVPNVARIALREAHYFFGGPYQERLVRKATDLHAAATDKERPHSLPNAVPQKIKLAIHFSGDEDRPVMLEIQPPFSARYSRLCDTGPIERWLIRERFDLNADAGDRVPEPELVGSH